MAQEGTKSDWIANRTLQTVIGTALRLPYKARVRTMGQVLRHGVGPLVGYRKRAEANLALIYPEMSKTEKRAIAKAVCDNFGRTLIENYSHQEFGAHLAGTEPHGVGLAALEQAKSDLRPVMFVTGHYGNHEAPRQVLTRMGYTIGGLYRPMGNPYFNAHYADTMTSWGGPVFEQGRKGTMGFAKHLRGGGMGTLLFDVKRSGGVPIPFMGRPALTSTSAADIALKYDALVIPYFATRQEDGLSFEIEIDAPIPHSDPITMTTLMSNALETRVIAHPEQWFWVHRRWKGVSAQLRSA